MELNGEVPLSATTTLQQVSNLLRQTLFEKKLRACKMQRKDVLQMYIGQF